MKKFIATALCLTMATPCFAAPNYRYDYSPAPHHNMPPRIERQIVTVHHHPAPPHHIRHHQSQRTRTLAVVAGVGIAATILSAIVD